MASSGLEELAGAGVLRRRSGRLSDAAVGLAAGRDKGVSSLCSARSRSEDALRNHGLASSHHATPLRKGGVHPTHTHRPPPAAVASAPFLSVQHLPSTLYALFSAHGIFFLSFFFSFSTIFFGVHKNAFQARYDGFGVVLC